MDSDAAATAASAATATAAASAASAAASAKTYENVEQLYHDIVTKVVDRKEVLKTISIELRFEYINYLSKLRQRKYRENHKELANERSKRSNAKRKQDDPEKYKEKCKQYNKKYLEKTGKNSSIL